MISGYAEPASFPAGELLRLRVSGDAEAFHVAVDRVGGLSPRMAVAGPWEAQLFPEGRCDEPWDWPSYVVPVPADLPSGVYIAHLLPCRGGQHGDCVPAQPLPVDGRDGRALFVVRPAPGAPRQPLLFKVPLATYHAYNASGGGSLYGGASLDPSTGSRAVTLSRPGGGTGGALSFPEAVDVYDPGTPREGVAHWDLPFLSWLERTGYRVDVCTDLDLDADPSLLEGYAALVTAGHDEYWSARTREAVEGFLAAGGSAAFFSGNACFWRVTLDPSGSRLTCRHPPVATADCDQWWRIRSETSLAGVSYRHGGGWWSGPRDALGYTVADAGHWVYDGTGLADGMEFGAQDRLVGYECDGAALDWSDADRPKVRPVTGEGEVHLLGYARLGSGWQERGSGDSSAATMAITVRDGVVFTAGTTDWPRLLAGGNPVVDRVTRNVLDRVSLPSRRLHAPRWAEVAAELSLWVDTRPGEAVQWQSSLGEVLERGPQAALLLPCQPCHVTISATIRRNGVGAGFATATVRVLSRAQSRQVELLTAARSLLQQIPPDPLPSVPPGPGNQQLGDTAWDALQDGLRRPVTAAEAERVARLAGDLARLADRLADLTAEEATRSVDGPA